jgi:GH15 family glucan-1,4-alpha-glucosidase
MGAVFLGDAHGVQIDHEGWLAVSDAIDWVCEHWDQPDEGIWETRGRKDFTYGRFQCWVALDRAIRLASRHGRPADLSRWMSERNEIYLWGARSLPACELQRWARASRRAP